MTNRFSASICAAWPVRRSTVGSFKAFDNVVLSRLASAAHRRAKLLRGRNRVVNAPLAQPIAIHLRGAVLHDAEATGDVLAELEQGKALAVAVLHRNPYMHAVVTDNSDGSNFDVVVTSPDVIHVYPGFRASPRCACPAHAAARRTVRGSRNLRGTGRATGVAR